MRWPIRFQILIPFTLLLGAAVMTISIVSAVAAARRDERRTLLQLTHVLEALVQSNFPLSNNVLTRMRGLSGAEFVVRNREGQIVGTTLPPERLEGDAFHQVSVATDVAELAEFTRISLQGTEYVAAGLRVLPTQGNGDLFVLYSLEQRRQAEREAAWPSLLVGFVGLIPVVMISFWLSGRFSRRILRIQQHVAAIADGDYRPTEIGRHDDELRDLVASVNVMSARIRKLEETIRRTERSRLLGQLAGGLAHSLRNAVTGARLAIQLHLRRCEQNVASKSTADDSLQVALAQLTLTEEQIRGLLRLGHPEQRFPTSCEVLPLLEEIAALLKPNCLHSHTKLEVRADSALGRVLLDRDAVRGALINLLLNGMEAAGVGGQVFLDAKIEKGNLVLTVGDNGSGPATTMVDELTEPFLSSKPEGIGLGLAIVRDVAEKHGGSLDWRRHEGWTVFQLRIPHANEGEAPRSTTPRSGMIE